MEGEHSERRITHHHDDNRTTVCDTVFTTGSVSADLAILDYTDIEALKRDHNLILSNLCQREILPEIRSQIWDYFTKAETYSLLLTKQLFSDPEVVGPALYRDIEVEYIHVIKPGSVLFGLPGGRDIHCGFYKYTEPDSDAIVSDTKRRLLGFTQVLRMKLGSCMGLPRQEGVVSFPDLRVLHKKDIEPCEARDSDVVACHIFEQGRSSRLHTLVLRNQSLLGTWLGYCSSSRWWTQVSRVVWSSSGPHWSLPDAKSDYPNKATRHGESLESFNTVFTPHADCKTSVPNLTQPTCAHEPSLTDRGERLADQLAEVCASEVRNVIIAGTEGLSEQLYLSPADLRNRIMSSYERTRLVRSRTMEQARALLTARGASEAQIQAKLGRIKFVTLEEYASIHNRPDELSLQELAVRQTETGFRTLGSRQIGEAARDVALECSNTDQDLGISEVSLAWG